MASFFVMCEKKEGGGGEGEKNEGGEGEEEKSEGGGGQGEKREGWGGGEGERRERDREHYYTELSSIDIAILLIMVNNYMHIPFC